AASDTFRRRGGLENRVAHAQLTGARQNRSGGVRRDDEVLIGEVGERSLGVDVARFASRRLEYTGSPQHLFQRGRHPSRVSRSRDPRGASPTAKHNDSVVSDCCQMSRSIGCAVCNERAWPGLQRSEAPEGRETRKTYTPNFKVTNSET